jgi:hypothetical protein
MLSPINTQGDGPVWKMSKTAAPVNGFDGRMSNGYCRAMIAQRVKRPG